MITVVSNVSSWAGSTSSRSMSRAIHRWYDKSAISSSPQWRAAKHITAWWRMGCSLAISVILSVNIRAELVQSIQRPRWAVKWWYKNASFGVRVIGIDETWASWWQLLGDSVDCWKSSGDAPGVNGKSVERFWYLEIFLAKWFLWSIFLMERLWSSFVRAVLPPWMSKSMFSLIASVREEQMRWGGSGWDVYGAFRVCTFLLLPRTVFSTESLTTWGLPDILGAFFNRDQCLQGQTCYRESRVKFSTASRNSSVVQAVTYFSVKRST